MEHQSEVMLLGYIELVWSAGWQPAELHRQGRISGVSSVLVRLLATIIGVDHSRRDPRFIDPRWIEQVDQIERPEVDKRAGFLHRWAIGEHLTSAELTDVVLNALNLLAGLRRIETLMPPPGKYRRDGSGAGGHSDGADIDPVLAKVRGLLAMAESTAFEAEALSFTVKAQELMTRHAIDAAMLAHGRIDDHTAPIAVRLPIDPPYTDAKSMLLQTVADAGRCRAVFNTGTAMSTVVGFADDVAAVDLLFTSLLVQAQAALADTAAKAPPGTRVRSQSYRSAFLLSFGNRIGDRLREINEAVFASVESDQGSEFLPVLRSMESAVDDAVTERYGDLVSSRVRGGYDAAGWAGGRQAADNAQLNRAVGAEN